MIDDEELGLLYRLNSLVRYNNRAKIKDETVAAHSYFTSLFTMMICDKLQLSDEIKLIAMQYSMIHDVPEIITNDITHDAKQLIPELNDILVPFENMFIQEHFPEQLDIFNVTLGKFDDNIFLARLVVKIADILSVIQYCTNEKKLGNVSLEPLLNEALQDKAFFQKKLEEVLDKAII